MSFSVPWENRPRPFSSVTTEAGDWFVPGEYREEMRAILAERDPEMYNEGLLALGARMESSGHLEAASQVYSVIVTTRPPLPPFGDPPPPGGRGIKRRAQARVDAIAGTGSSAYRTEFLLRHLARETMEPTTLVGMTAASAAFRLTRLAALTGLGGSSASHFLTRGFGARAAASLLGFGVESTVFPLAGRGAGLILGRDLDWSWNQVGREIGSSFLVLGAMKLTGVAARATMIRSGMAEHGGILPVMNQAGMFAGIVLGHHLETVVGLRPHLNGATTLADSLAMLIQFNAAGRLAQGIMGQRFRNWELGMELQTARLAGPPSPVSWRKRLALPAAAAGLLSFLVPTSAHAAFEVGNSSSPLEALGMGASLLAATLGAVVVYRSRRRGPWLGGIWKSRAPEASEGMQDIITAAGSDRHAEPVGLLPKFAEAYTDTVTAIRDREVSDAAGLSLLVDILQTDWLARIESHHVRVETISFEQFRDQLLAKSGRAPDWMFPILTSTLGEYAEIHEAIISARQMQSYDPKQNADPAFFESFKVSCGLGTFFHDLLNLPRGTLYEPQASGGLVMRYLPTTVLLEMGGNLHGVNAVRPLLVSRLVTEEEMRILAERDERPMLITNRTQSRIHNFRDVHPYVAWEHDIYHALKIGRIPRVVRSEWPMLYDTMLALQPRFPEHSDMIQGIRESLFEGDHSDASGNGRLFAHIYGKHPGAEFLRALRRELNSRFSEHRRRESVLHDFEATFGPTYR